MDLCKAHARTDRMEPVDYAGRAAWLDRMAATHEQALCHGCRLWRLWHPKAAP